MADLYLAAAVRPVARTAPATDRAGLVLAERPEVTEVTHTTRLTITTARPVGSDISLGLLQLHLILSLSVCRRR